MHDRTHHSLLALTTHHSRSFQQQRVHVVRLVLDLLLPDACGVAGASRLPIDLRQGARDVVVARPQAQHFLERGFDAFSGMRGAKDFLATIRRRELEVNRRLFARDPDPFRPVD